MDWTGTSEQANDTVELAVVKVEATVPVTDSTYGGAVVLNPGMFQMLLTWTTLTGLQVDLADRGLVRSSEVATMCAHCCLLAQTLKKMSSGYINIPTLPFPLHGSKKALSRPPINKD